MSEKIVQLNEEVIKGQLKELVRGSVEETLNELLEAEAEKLTQAARYERNDQRQGYRSGHYSRNLTTTSGDVTLKVPKLKGISPFHSKRVCRRNLFCGTPFLKRIKLKFYAEKIKNIDIIFQSYFPLKNSCLQLIPSFEHDLNKFALEQEWYLILQQFPLCLIREHIVHLKNI